MTVTISKPEINFREELNYLRNQVPVTRQKIKVVTAAYSFVAQDFTGDWLIVVNSGSDVILTIPAGLDPQYACGILRYGAGEVDIAASGSVIRSDTAFLSIDTQYNIASLIPLKDIAVDEYLLAGKLKA